jgi:hypothetical protein
LIVYSDTVAVKQIKKQPFLIVDFRKKLEGMINETKR